LKIKSEATIFDVTEIIASDLFLLFMKKSFIIIIVIAVGAVGALYSLPKVVVSDEKKTLETSEKPHKGDANRDKGRDSQPEVANTKHEKALSDSQISEISSLRVKYLQNTDKTTKLKSLEALVSKFVEFMKYDSAAYYAETVVKLEPSETNLMKTAYLYYQAHTFALEDSKRTAMGENARTYYTKVLSINPNNLLAKTNMAMTYVATPNPMQGILLLREVIAQEPDYVPALYSLGMLSIQSKQFGKAVERFKEVLKIEPANSDAALKLGYCLVQSNRNEEAKEILEKVLKNSKTQTEKAGAQELLEAIR
jgi:tetratricopeptide (TPR) repeat protein